MTRRRRLVIAVAAAWVASSVGVVGGLVARAEADPTPSATGSLVLTPASGPPGTQVEAVALRLKCSLDAVTFSWVGHEQDVSWSAPFAVDGNVGASTTVPVSFPPGDYTIRATCYYLESSAFVDATFVVTAAEPQAPATLALEPDVAAPGESVAATVTGLACPADAVTVIWRETGAPWSVRPDLGRGVVTASASVPESFAPGRHDVVASCLGASGTASVTATLNVTGTQTPVLALDPRVGLPGTALEATATGHQCYGVVVFLWGGGATAGTAPPGSAGPATARISVPEEFAPGRHEVVARCDADGFVWPAAFFTVSPVSATPELAVRPGTGQPGSELTATASGHACRGLVVFSWPGGAGAAAARPDRAGIATAHLRVPTGLTPGRHPLGARCRADGFAWPPVAFAVTAAAVTPSSGSTWRPSPWWSGGAVLAVVTAATTVLVLRSRRGVRWVRHHVRAVAAGRPFDLETPESPAAGSPADISIGIQPHPDHGWQTIEEVGS